MHNLLPLDEVSLGGDVVASEHAPAPSARCKKFRIVAVNENCHFHSLALSLSLQRDQCCKKSKTLTYILSCTIIDI